MLLRPNHPARRHARRPCIPLAIPSGRLTDEINSLYLSSGLLAFDDIPPISDISEMAELLMRAYTRSWVVSDVSDDYLFELSCGTSH